MYVHQDYPKYLYRAGETPRRVNDAAEHGALGTGWYDSPVAADAAAAQADAAQKDAEAAAQRDAAEAQAIYDASVTAIAAKLDDASEEVLLRVKAYEEQNPNHQGGRKGVLDAVEKALKALQSQG